MNGTDARRMTNYLRTIKCRLIKVHTKYNSELGAWTILILNKDNDCAVEYCLLNHDTFKSMCSMAKSLLSW